MCNFIDRNGSCCLTLCSALSFRKSHALYVTMKASMFESTLETIAGIAAPSGPSTAPPRFSQKDASCCTSGVSVTSTCSPGTSTVDSCSQKPCGNKNNEQNMKLHHGLYLYKLFNDENNLLILSLANNQLPKVKPLDLL